MCLDLAGPSPQFNAVHICAPAACCSFFMFLLWLVNIAVKADNPNEPVFSNNPYPDVDVVGPIPECSTDTFARLPCWDFFYTPNNSSTVQVSVGQVSAPEAASGWSSRPAAGSLCEAFHCGCELPLR